MTVQQLIELSILDALALLDEDERLQFESAFRAASPAIQAHVRREQTRLAQIESLLPQVEPPAGLRAMVLEAVRAHMATPAADDGFGRLLLPLTARQNVSPFWRAGALGAAAAAIMLGITTFLFKSENDMMANRLRNETLLGQLTTEYGSRFIRDVLFNRDTERVVFASEQAGFTGEAALFINPDWPTAKFFCRSITTPAGRVYKLAVLDEEGQVVKVLKEFVSDGELMPLDVQVTKGTVGHIAVLAAGTQPGQETVLARGSLGEPRNSGL